MLAALTRIAPEVDAATLRGNEPLRQQVDIDSMDFLNLIIELHRDLGVEIPESDYAELTTLDDMVKYLSARAPAPGAKT